MTHFKISTHDRPACQSWLSHNTCQCFGLVLMQHQSCSISYARCWFDLHINKTDVHAKQCQPKIHLQLELGLAQQASAQYCYIRASFALVNHFSFARKQAPSERHPLYTLVLNVQITLPAAYNVCSTRHNHHLLRGVRPGSVGQGFLQQPLILQPMP